LFVVKEWGGGIKRGQKEGERSCLQREKEIVFKQKGKDETKKGKAPFPREGFVKVNFGKINLPLKETVREKGLRLEKGGS